MKYTKKILTGLVLGLWLAAPAHADDLDVSMTLLDSSAMSSDAATKVIKLPDAASDTGRTNSEFGLATANSAKSRGRKLGKEKSDAAKRKGALKRKGPK